MVSLTTLPVYLCWSCTGTRTQGRTRTYKNRKHSQWQPSSQRISERSQFCRETKVCVSSL